MCCSRVLAGRPRGRAAYRRLAAHGCVTSAASSNARAEATAARAAGAAGIAAPDVHLDALDARAAAAGADDAQSVPVQAEGGRRRRRAAAAAGAGSAAAPAGPPAPPPLPPITLKFIGIVDATGQTEDRGPQRSGRARRSRQRRRHNRWSATGFCGSAWSRSRCRISTAAAGRRSGSRDHECRIGRRIQIASRDRLADAYDDTSEDSCCWWRWRSLAGGCAAGQAFRQGDVAMKAGDLDQAVAYYRKAVQASPDNAELQDRARARACSPRRGRTSTRRTSSSRRISSRRRCGEYQLASEYDPSNRQAAAKVAAARADDPRPHRSGAAAGRRSSSCASARARRRPSRCSTRRRASRCGCSFTTPASATSSTLIGNATGINITYDRDVHGPRRRVQLDGVTLEQALQPDHDDEPAVVQGPRTSARSSCSRTTRRSTRSTTSRSCGRSTSRTPTSTELTQLLSTIIRLPGIAVQPAIQSNKTANTITVRGTAPVVADHREDHRAERQAARRDHRSTSRSSRSNRDARQAATA